MLVVEKTSNGRTIVVIKRDWHPGRIGRAYMPKVRSMSDGEIRWQKVLCKPALV
jgi:hypothetical protein